MQKIKTLIFSLVSAFILVTPVLADDFTTNTLKGNAMSKLSKISSLNELMSRGITAMVMFMGSIALALIVFAGFLWMTASGNEKKMEQAKTIIVWTLLGSIAIGASYGFVTFIIKIFG